MIITLPGLRPWVEVGVCAVVGVCFFRQAPGPVNMATYVGKL